MNIKKKYLVVFFVLISICHAYGNSLNEHKIKLEFNREIKEDEQLELSRFPRDTETMNNVSCDCCCDNCKGGNGASISPNRSDITTINDIVKNILTEFNSILKTFHNNFEYAAILGTIADTPDQKFPMFRLMKEYLSVNNTITHLMGLFNKIYHIKNNNENSNSNESMLKLKSHTRGLLGQLSNTTLSGILNLQKIFEFIQQKIDLMMNNFSNNNVKLKNIIPNLLNGTMKIFGRKGDRGPINENEENAMKSVREECSGLLGKMLHDKNSKKFLPHLKNETIKMFRKVDAKFPGMHMSKNWLKKIQKKGDSSLSGKFPLISLLGIDFDWKKPVYGLKISLKNVKNIPLHIIGLFKAVKMIIIPKRIIKTYWKTMKGYPLFVAQCFSSKIEKLFGISQFKSSTATSHFIPQYHRYKSNYLSLWEKLKQKLFHQCNCQ